MPVYCVKRVKIKKKTIWLNSLLLPLPFTHAQWRSHNTFSRKHYLPYKIIITTESSAKQPIFPTLYNDSINIPIFHQYNWYKGRNIRMERYNANVICQNAGQKKSPQMIQLQLCSHKSTCLQFPPTFEPQKNLTFQALTWRDTLYLVNFGATKMAWSSSSKMAISTSAHAWKRAGESATRTND